MAAASKPDLPALLVEWQRRLRLQDWRIDLRVEPVWTLGDSMGRVEPSPHYQTAIIRIRDPQHVDPNMSWVVRDPEHTLVHELLHLLIPERDDVEGEDVQMECAINHLAEALVTLRRDGK
jgi:hypothetical protein